MARSAIAAALLASIALAACNQSSGSDPLAAPLASRFEGAPRSTPEKTLDTKWKSVTLGGPKSWGEVDALGIVGFEEPKHAAFVQLDTRKGDATPPAPIVVTFAIAPYAEGAKLGAAVDGKIGARGYPAKIQESTCTIKDAPGRCWAIVIAIGGGQSLLVAGAQDGASPAVRAQLADSIRSIAGG